jgi:hypothetical protein
VDASQSSGPAGDFESARRDATAKLAAAIGTRPGHIVVTGPDDVTEALLTDAVAATPIHRTIRVQGRSLDPDAVVTSLCADKIGAGQPWIRQREAMRALVEEAREAGQPIVVAVAGADWADVPRLERLRQMTECVPEATDVVRMVLLGGPRLVTMLRRAEARKLATRVVAVVQAPTPPPRFGRRAIALLPGPRALAAGLAGLGFLFWLVASRREQAPDTRLVLAPMVAQAPQGPPPSVPRTQEQSLSPLPEPHDAVPPAPNLERPPSPPSPAAPVPAPTATIPAPAASAPTPSAPAAAIPAPAASVPASAGPTPEHAPPAPPPTSAARLAPSAPPAAARPAPERTPPPAAPTKQAATSAPAPPPVARPTAGRALQVGAFQSADAAEALRRRLAEQFADVRVSTVDRNGVTLHRVRVVGLASDTERAAAVAALRKAGYSPIEARE